MADANAEPVVQTGITSAHTHFTTKFEWNIVDFRSRNPREKSFLIKAFDDIDVLCEAVFTDGRYAGIKTFACNLKLIDPTSDTLRCTYTLAIKCAAGAPPCSDKKTFQLTTKPHQLNNFINEAYVENDIIIASFEVEIIRSENGSGSEVGLPMSVAEFTSSLLGDKILSDVTIVCQDKSFSCHKIILAGRSEVYHRMFTSDFKEARGTEVEIVGEPDVVEQFIKYIYEDSVGEDAFTWELFELAKMYEISRLQRLCLRSLRKGLNVDNCCRMLEAAFVHDLEDLFDHAMRFFNEKRTEVAQTEGWKNIVPNNNLLAKIILYGTAGTN